MKKLPQPRPLTEKNRDGFQDAGESARPLMFTENVDQDGRTEVYPASVENMIPTDATCKPDLTQEYRVTFTTARQCSLRNEQTLLPVHTIKASDPSGTWVRGALARRLAVLGTSSVM